MNYIFDTDYRLSGIFVDDESANKYINKMAQKLVTFNDQEISVQLDKKTLIRIYEANGQMLVRSFKTRDEAAWWVMTLLKSKTGPVEKKEKPRKNAVPKKEAPKNDNLSRK